MSWPRQIVFESAFTAKEVAKIEQLASLQAPVPEFEIFQDKESKDWEERLLTRNRKTAFIFDVIEEMMLIANREFKYDIDRLLEPIGHHTYRRAGHIAWHIDSGEGNLAKRKLSVSVLLSDPGNFRGGQLEFCPGGGLRNGKSAGSAVVFPAYMPHRITPVSKGVRRSLVAWMLGREFR